jgi:hypothetical protein
VEIVPAEDGDNLCIDLFEADGTLEAGCLLPICRLIDGTFKDRIRCHSLVFALLAWLSQDFHISAFPILENLAERKSNIDHFPNHNALRFNFIVLFAEKIIEEVSGGLP